MSDLDMEFVDAVFSIPKNAVKITIDVQTYEDGVLQNVCGEFLPADIREAVNLFEATVAGDYPKYVLTDEGRRLIGELKT